jgi:hypothetical protein
VKRFCFALAIACVAIACNPKSLRPNYCRNDRECTEGRVCGPKFMCEEPNDGSVDSIDGGDARDGAEVPFRCKGPSDCTDGGLKVCEPDAGMCVGCLANSDCSESTQPICNLSTRMCERCTTDAQCVGRVTGPGICMFHQDGRCATDAETIYVKNSTGCTMTAGVGGTTAVPYCFSQLGIDAAVMGPNRLVVMRGPDALRFWTISASGDQVTVVGQNAATIAPGADVGIRVSGGNVYIRGLRVTGSSSTGMVVDNGAELHMDGCRVENNVLGGIRVDGAGFDITNTVLAGNRSTSSPGCGGWAGACFNNISGTPRFLNNTVVSNVGTGIACNNNAVTILGSIAFGNTLDVSLCTDTPCCTGNPALTADYHLMSGSPCIGALDSAIAAPDDIDGQIRANGQMNDCGADEL